MTQQRDPFLQDLASMFDTETEQFIVADERRFTSFLEEEVGRAEEVEQAEEGGFLRGLTSAVGGAGGAVGGGIADFFEQPATAQPVPSDAVAPVSPQSTNLLGQTLGRLIGPPAAALGRGVGALGRTTAEAFEQQAFGIGGAQAEFISEHVGGKTPFDIAFTEARDSGLSMTDAFEVAREFQKNIPIGDEITGRHGVSGFLSGVGSALRGDLGQTGGERRPLFEVGVADLASEVLNPINFVPLVGDPGLITAPLRAGRRAAVAGGRRALRAGEEAAEAVGRANVGNVLLPAAPDTRALARGAGPEDVAGRKRSIDELRQAGGKPEFSKELEVRSEFGGFATREVTPKNIDELRRRLIVELEGKDITGSAAGESNLARSLSSLIKEEGGSLRGLSDEELTAVEDLLGQNIRNIPKGTDIASELSRAAEEITVKSRILLRELDDLAANADADVIQRGIDRIGLTEPPAAPAARQADEALVRPPEQPPVGPTARQPDDLIEPDRIERLIGSGTDEELVKERLRHGRLTDEARNSGNTVAEKQGFQSMNKLDDEIRRRGVSETVIEDILASDPEEIALEIAFRDAVETPAIRPVARPISLGGEPPRQPPGVSQPADIGRQGILLEVPPTEIGENLLDLRPIQIRELGVVDRAVNNARATLGRLTNREVVLKNKLVKSAFDEVRRAQPRIISQKNLLAANIDRAKASMRQSGTVFDKDGRIPRLSGVDPNLRSNAGPTIPDLAARRPRYLANLTDAERRALEDMRLELEPWRNAMDEVGLEVSGRSDLVTAADPTEAGFYMPRGGNPATPDVPRSTRGAGGRIGAEMRAPFASMAQAIDEGATYFPLGDAMANHGQSMGERLANLHAANFLQRLEVETGIPLGRAGGRPLPGELSLPSGSGVPSLRELRGTTFPPEITNAVNEILATQGELIGKGSEILKAINAYNNFYRTSRSTLDNSAFMIQGVLGTATDPQAAARAMLLNAEIWKSGQAREIFGRFVEATDQHALDVLGIPDFSRTAAQKGLIFQGGETELTQSIITRVPGIRRAGNAFGFYGDALRDAWLADEVAIEMARTGKSGLQIVGDGTMERLAKAINPATGVTEGNRFTDIASIATFAPRFLQSRLTTVARGIRGLDIDAPLDILPSGVRRRIPIREAPLNPAARLEDRIARKALIRLIGYGVAITVAANAAQGQETDFRLFVNGRLNPNFVRVRFGERDFSVLGTWDSILKLIIGTVQGVSQGNINTILGSARGLGSGLVTQAWDLLSGRDFEGRETTSDPVTFAAHIGRSHLPFQAEELPAAGGKIVEGVREGDIGQIATGAAQIALEAHGAKSSPLSGKDQLDIATDAGNFSADRFDDLEPFERNEVRDAVGDVFRGRGTPQDVFFDGIDQIESREPGTLGESDVGGREPRRAQLLAQAGTLSVDGALGSFSRGLSNNEILDEWFSIESDAAAERNGLRLGTGVEFDAERDEGEQLIEQWFAIFGIPSVRDKIGRAKFTELDKHRKAFLARLNPVQREFLLRNTHLRPVDTEMLRILERAGARGTVKNIRDSEAARERFRANPQRTDIGEVAPSPSAPQPATPIEPTVPTRTLDQLFGQRAQ